MASRDTITFDVKDGVALLTFNRPDVLNSINATFIADVRSAIAETAASPAIRALVLTGAGRGFCAGADLAANDPVPDGLSTGEKVAFRLGTRLNPMAADLMALEKPVVAAVNGVAAGGGCGLALAADIVIAAKSASFILVFGPKLGLVPDLGTSWHLPRLIGRARALGLALTGDKLPAETAAEWGLIWKCVEDEMLMNEAMTLAGKLAKGPISAFDAIGKALATGEHNSFDEQLAYEAAANGRLGDHPNYTEGVNAFREKRDPKFT